MFASVIRAFFSTPRSSAHQRIADVEAQPSTDIFTPFNPAAAAPPPPPAAFTLETRRVSSHIPFSEPTQNAVDIFFGVSSRSQSSRGTVDSCHDLRPAASSPTCLKDKPPAYVYPVATSVNEFGAEELPTYAQTLGADHLRGTDADEEEPASLAMYLFKFGFLCPILWFLSVFILFSPLTAPTDWEQSKTPAQRAHLLARMRASEVRWAKRSIVAALALCTVIGIAVTVTIVMRH